MFEEIGRVEKALQTLRRSRGERKPPPANERQSARSPTVAGSASNRHSLFRWLWLRSGDPSSLRFSHSCSLMTVQHWQSQWHTKRSHISRVPMALPVPALQKRLRNRLTQVETIAKPNRSQQKNPAQFWAGFVALSGARAIGDYFVATIAAASPKSNVNCLESPAASVMTSCRVTSLPSRTTVTLTS